MSELINFTLYERTKGWPNEAPQPVQFAVEVDITDEDQGHADSYPDGQTIPADTGYDEITATEEEAESAPAPGDGAGGDDGGDIPRPPVPPLGELPPPDDDPEKPSEISAEGHETTAQTIGGAAIESEIVPDAPAGSNDTSDEAERPEQPMDDHSEAPERVDTSMAANVPEQAEEPAVPAADSIGGGTDDPPTTGTPEGAGTPDTIPRSNSAEESDSIADVSETTPATEDDIHTLYDTIRETTAGGTSFTWPGHTGEQVTHEQLVDEETLPDHVHNLFMKARAELDQVRPEATAAGVAEVTYIERRAVTGPQSGGGWVTIDGKMGRESYDKSQIEFVRREEDTANNYAQEVRILYETKKSWLGGPPFRPPKTMSSAQYSSSRTLTMLQGSLDPERLRWKFPSFLNTDPDLELKPVEDFSRSEAADIARYARRALPPQDNNGRA